MLCIVIFFIEKRKFLQSRIEYLFSACTVTQWKIKMQTIQYGRTRIWEMKKDKYTKTLAKN